jgi:hypothetical protein
LLASLDKAIYSHGEEIHVFVQIKNNSNKTIRRIKVVQRGILKRTNEATPVIPENYSSG